MAVSSNTSPFAWSTVAPPLTPEATQLYSARRRQAETNLGFLKSESNALSGEAEARMIFDRSKLRGEVADQLRAGLVQASGRGLGYAPMFAGRLRRDAAEFQQQGEAELQMNFTNRLNELQRAITKGELQRDRELLQISQEEAAQRMALQLSLLGAGVTA